MALAPVPSDASPLRCVAWAEQDLAGEWTVVWSFPGPSSREAECLIAARSADVDGPCFSRVGDDWCYSAPVAYAAPRERGRAAGAVHLITSEFHPERWLPLAAHVAGLAEKDPSPLPIQRAYLEAVTSGEVASAGGLAELAELATTSWSIAGTTAAALEGMPSLWDVWVDLSARRVGVSAACEGLLRADTPAHATAMAAAVEAASAAGGAGAEAAGPAIGRALAKVSKQLVAKLSDVGEPTEAALKAAGVTGPMVQLMLGIARAEPGVRVPAA